MDRQFYRRTIPLCRFGKEKPCALGTSPRGRAAGTDDHGAWGLALYNTATDALLGILWLMIVFAFVATVAVAFIRRSKIQWLLPERQEIRGSWSK